MIVPLLASRNHLEHLCDASLVPEDAPWKRFMADEWGELGRIESATRQRAWAMREFRAESWLYPLQGAYERLLSCRVPH